jgi:ComF family protein
VRCVRSACWERAELVSQSIMHAFKYDGWHGLAPELATQMARLDWPPDVLDERTALVPVPLGAGRRRERGFNQSEEIARALSAEWEIPVWSDVLTRGRETQTQTRLTPGERIRNVSGAFCASSQTRDRLRGAHLVVVDDVVTTASTLNACAAALCDGGARIVSYVTFARAPAIGDRC